MLLVEQLERDTLLLCKLPPRTCARSREPIRGHVRTCACYYDKNSITVKDNIYREVRVVVFVCRNTHIRPVIGNISNTSNLISVVNISLITWYVCFALYMCMSMYAPLMISYLTIHLKNHCSS